MLNVLAYITLALAFVPFIHLLPITAEIQPIYLVSGVLLAGLRRQISVRWVFFLVFFIAMYAGYVAHNEVTEKSLESLFIIALTPLGILVGRSISISEIRIFLPYPLFISCIIGGIQGYFPWVGKILGIEAILATLIPRASISDLSEWGRGVTLLSPEPSYSAYQIFFLVVATALVWQQLNRKIRILYLFCICFLLAINKSATSVIVVGAFLVPLIVLHFMSGATPRKVLIFSVATIFSLWGLGKLIGEGLLESDNIDFRAINVMSQAAVGMQEGNVSVDDLLAVANNFGSQREVSVVVGYYAGLTSIVSNEFGMWSNSYIYYMEKYGLDPRESIFFSANGYPNVKPHAYFSLVAMDLGIVVAVFVLVFSLWNSQMILMIKSRRKVAICAIGSCVFLTAFSSPTALPIPWIIMGMCNSMRYKLGLIAFGRKHAR